MVGFENSVRRAEHPFNAQYDPVLLKINTLENQLKEKKMEVRGGQSEIKALKATDAAKDRALDELRNEVNKMDERLRASEKLVEQKNLEINKLMSEKKDAFSAQIAAESALRRLYMNQKHNDSIHIDSVAPLEADIKTYKTKIVTLQEDKKALIRLTRSKELALVKAEKILKMSLERSLIVEEVQNQNMDLKRQIEIFQDEKRVLERELSRAKIAANRVATVITTSEWKDENDKVMIPVKEWMEERKVLQAEMQRLRDKLKVFDGRAKSEARFREKLQGRLKTLKGGLKS